MLLTENDDGNEGPSVRNKISNLRNGKKNDVPSIGNKSVTIQRFTPCECFVMQ